MKLWMKIYILAFVAFVLTFNIAGIAIIEKIHNDSVTKEVERSLNEHKGFSYIMDFAYSKSAHTNKSESADKIIKESAGAYLNQSNTNIDIQISDMNERIIFSNTDLMFMDREQGLLDLEGGKRKYIIREYSHDHILFIAGIETIGSENYKIQYTSDISHIYDERDKQYMFFLKFQANICLVFGTLLYFASKILTRPIDKIIQSTQSIAKGNYDIRLPINSKDELGLLSADFNAMADAIEEKICELERLNEEKQRFIDNLTHELKTPLTSIIGYANLLRTTKVNEKVLNQAVDYIYSEGKKLENLSGKMLDLIILKKDHFELKPTDLVPLVKDVTNSMQHKLEEKNIDVQILGKPVMVLSDRYLFQVLLSNLIDNAIKASPKDSTINVMVYLEDENTVVEVEDSGVGIPDAHLDKIMEPFYMVDKSRSGSRESSGLGLSICKKIADIHNAQIDFSSKVDRGTSVKIILP